MKKLEVTYEMRVRLLIAFLAFLIGMTLGWLTGETGLDRWWIFAVDIAFFGVMIFLAVKILLQDLFKE